MRTLSIKQHRIIQWIAITLILSIGAGWYYQVQVRGAQTTVSEAPSFQADLKSTLDLQSGVGSPTFTRATTASVTDFEGLVRNVKSGEARFEGARRVENLVTYSEDFSNASWAKETAVSVTSNTATAPDGTLTADSAVYGASGNRFIYKDTPSGTAGFLSNRTFVLSLWIRMDTGTDTAQVALGSNAGGGTYTYSSSVPITTTWKRISVTKTFGADTGTALRTLFIANLSKTYYIWGIQTEEITGQANQNPSEYVSTNVKTAAPYHGANVDGVKYFTTQNGNTVASNVVTEATGAAIPDATLHGYVSEGARTNALIYSEQFDNAALIANDTNLLATVADAAVAPSGASSADKIIPDTNNLSHFTLQNSSITSGTTYTQSYFVKAAGYSFVQIASSTGFDMTNTWANFNLSNGTLGAVGPGTFTTNIQAFPNGWYRISLSAAATSTVSGRFVIAVLNADTASRIPSFAGDGTSGVYAWGAQLEAGAFASSYIPTTATSVPRNGDLLTYPTTGNININAITKYAEFQAVGISSYVLSLNDTTANERDLFYIASLTGYIQHYITNGGVNQAVIANGVAFNTNIRHKIASSSILNRFFFAGDGAQIGSTDISGTMPSALTRICPGSDGSGTQLFGTVRNVKIWKKALTDAQLTNLTNATDAVAAGAVKKATLGTDAPTFQADLKSTLDLQSGVGSPTFTRATTATVTDFEGLVRNVKSGEARFEGARRVENLVTYSEDFSNAIWQKAGTITPTVTSNTSMAPDGTLTADTFDYAANNSSAHLYQTGKSFVTGNTYTVSVYVKTSSGTDTFNVKVWDGVTDFLSPSLTATTTWKRFSYTITSTNTTSAANIAVYDSDTSAHQIIVWGMQLEDVTGQANKNPSEYVSTNVKTAAPYHGANVDGVKYFTTQNGNTVASNVVTEATGAAISSAGANLLKSSEDYSDTVNWTNLGSTTTTNNVTGPMGTLTADTITLDATTAIHGNFSNATVAAGTTATHSRFIKAGTARYVTLAISNGYNGPHIVIDTQTWTITETGAEGTGTYVGSSLVSVGNGWYRASVTGTVGPSVTTYGASCYSSNSATPGTHAPTYAGDGTSTIITWGAQLEVASSPSVYTPTTATLPSQIPQGYLSEGSRTNAVLQSEDYADANWTNIGSAPTINNVTSPMGTLTADTITIDSTTNFHGNFSIVTVAAGATATHSRFIKAGTARYVTLAIANGLNGPHIVIDTQTWTITETGAEGTGTYVGSSLVSVGNGWYRASVTGTVGPSVTTYGASCYSSNSATPGTHAPVYAGDGTSTIITWGAQLEVGSFASSYIPTAATSVTRNQDVLTYPTAGNIGLGNTSIYLEYIPKANSAMSGTPNHPNLFALNSGNNNTYRFEIAAGGSTMATVVGDVSSYATNTFTKTFTAGTKYKVAFSDANLSAKTFIDGAAGSALTGYAARSALPTDMNIGYIPSFSERNAWGIIRSVKIWKKALTDTQLQNLTNASDDVSAGAVKKTTVNVSQNLKSSNGLVGLWSFNGYDMSGVSAYDRSGSNGNGVLTNGPTVTPGKVGQSLQFDGVNDYVSIPNSTALNPTYMSVSAWIKTSATGIYQQIIAKDQCRANCTTSFNRVWQFRVSSANKAEFIPFNTNSTPTWQLITGSTTVTDGQWHHLVGTWDGTTVRLYVDGVSDATPAAFSGSLASGKTNPVFIGADDLADTGTQDYFRGAIDEVRLYNRALSASEVWELYNLGK